VTPFSDLKSPAKDEKPVLSRAGVLKRFFKVCDRALTAGQMSDDIAIAWAGVLYEWMDVCVCMCVCMCVCVCVYVYVCVCMYVCVCV
jgi:hypothetical protein